MKKDRPMKIQASLIVSAVGVLKAIDTTDMKLSTSYKVKTVLAACQLAVEDFEAKRVKMAEKHGTLSEDKSHYEFTKDGSNEAFQKEMQSVLDDKIEMDVNKIPFELLDDYITIAPANVQFVEWFISGLEA